VRSSDPLARPTDTPLSSLRGNRAGVARSTKEVTHSGETNNLISVFLPVRFPLGTPP
jgi:hypothetical protein